MEQNGRHKKTNTTDRDGEQKDGQEKEETSGTTAAGTQRDKSNIRRCSRLKKRH